MYLPCMDTDKLLSFPLVNYDRVPSDW
jgi:hypothetical protein